MLECEPFAGSPHPDFDLVEHQIDPMPVAERPQLRHEIVGRHDIATVTLHSFDEDGCHLIGRADGLEQIVLEITEAAIDKILAISTEWIAIWIRIGNLGHMRAAEHTAQ